MAETLVKTGETQAGVTGDGDEDDPAPSPIAVEAEIGLLIDAVVGAGDELTELLCAAPAGTGAVSGWLKGTIRAG